MNEHERLVRLLARRAYREGDFVLSSGRRSGYYLDAKQVTYDPEGIRLVGPAVCELLEPFGATAVGGLTLGADAIVSSVVWASGGRGRPIPGFVVRKEPKGHGLRQWIEGIFPDGVRACLVDDVITSGASVLRAAEVVREAGGEVAVAVGLVDREEGGGEAIEAAGIPFRAVCKLDEIRDAFRTDVAHTR